MKTNAPVIIERTFSAPTEALWKAITHPEQMRRWFFESIESFEPRVGFETRVDVRHEEKLYIHLWKVTEVVPGRRISCEWRYPDYPGLALVTMELAPAGPFTRLKITHSGLETFPPDNPDFSPESCFGGWSSLLARLTKFLGAQQPFVITRLLDAPCERVWSVWTASDQMQWWGPKGVTIRHAKMGLRPGGTFHYCMTTPEGREMWGRWVIREVAKPERLVFINSFSDAAGGLTRHPLSPSWPLEILSTVTFAERGRKTLLSIEWLPINASEAEIKTFNEGHESMRNGWTGTLDRLSEYLGSEPRSQSAVSAERPLRVDLR